MKKRLSELLEEADRSLREDFDNPEALLPKTLKLVVDITRESAGERAKEVTALLSLDNHNWSNRPCSTCRAVTALLGADFGCVLKAKGLTP